MKPSLSRLTFFVPGHLSKLEAGFLEERLGSLPGVYRIHFSEAQQACKVECDESVVSAQELANRVWEDSRQRGTSSNDTPALVVKIPRLTTNLYVGNILCSLPGVSGVVIRPDLQQILVSFHSEGNLTTTLILNELHREGITAAL